MKIVIKTSIIFFAIILLFACNSTNKKQANNEASEKITDSLVIKKNINDTNYVSRVTPDYYGTGWPVLEQGKMYNKEKIGMWKYYYPKDSASYFIVIQCFDLGETSPDSLPDSLFSKSTIAGVEEMNSYEDGHVETYDYKRYFPNGKVMSKGSYANGHGYDSSFCWSGELRIKEKMVDGYLEGERLIFDINCKLEAREFYVNGNQEGLQYNYYSDGSICSKVTYVNGVMEGEVISYFSSGKKRSKRNYSNGELNGEQIDYYTEGVPHFVYNFKNGKKHGEQLEWAKGGGLLYGREIYIDGNYQVEKQEKSRSSDGQKCSRCMGHYQGGFCGICGGASGERVNESYSKAAKCEFCGGSGFIPKGGIHGGSKLCPSCKGKGKQIY